MKYLDKENEILNICKGKKVLHLGAVGFTDLTDVDRINNFPNTLHYKLSNVANVIGIDYSKSVIDMLSRNGINNIIYGNVEELEKVHLNETFEVIVVGDLIEHLANPGLLLNGMKRFCDENTRIIITTPNAFGLLNFIRYFFNRFKEGDEHVMTFNTQNISNLVSRFNYKIVSIDTSHQVHAKAYGIRFHIIKFFFKLFPKLSGTLFLIIKKE